VTSAIDFVYFGRNDNYHVDYLERTNACLNYNLRSIHQAGLIGKVRLLFVDWASEQPLTEKLAVKGIYSESIQVLYIDSIFLEKYDFNLENINPPFACNIGLYHSKADYLFWAASDLIATPQDFQNLYRATQELSGHEDTKLWMAERAFLSRDFFTKPRSFEDVDYYLRNFYFESEPICGAGSGAALIGAKRTRLIEWGGLNEACSSWGGNDIELFIRATKYESYINLSNRYGVYFHKFPYANSGERSLKVRLASMDWTKHIDSINSNGSRSALIENICHKNVRISSTVPIFPVINNAISHSSTLLFYKAIVVFLTSYKELLHLMSVRQVLQASLPDAIVLDGGFSVHFVRAACFVCRTMVLVWRYPDGAVRHVVSSLHTSRNFLRAAEIQDYFRGNIFAIRENHKVYLNRETLAFLNGKKVIIFTKDNNHVYFNIMDGHFLDSLQPDLGLPNNDSRKINVIRDPAILIVILLVFAISSSNWLFKKFHALIPQLKCVKF